jgi:hypothetical protein
VVAEFDAHNAKGVYVFRDVRDVTVSRMRKSGQAFSALLNVGFLERILSAFDRWTSLPGVLVSRYEDVVGDVATEVGRIAAHLGIIVSREECTRVADDYTLARQLERVRLADAAGRLRRSGQAVYDPVSNLHVDHIRSGRSGEWRTALTLQELAVIEDQAGAWLTRNGYALSLNRWTRVILKGSYVLRQRCARTIRAPQEVGR